MKGVIEGFLLSKSSWNIGLSIHATEFENMTWYCNCSILILPRGPELYRQE